MKVIIAKKAGFCMGVRRAVDLTLDLVNKEGKNISTFGPLIHNPQVLEVLEDKGVGVLKEIPSQGSGTVIVRAHGVPPSEKANLKKSGFDVKDATCPRVLKVQAIINKHKKEGRTTVIIGDRNHAEVDGLMGFAGPDCFVVSNQEEADKIELSKPYLIVSQTTQDQVAFDQITKIISDRFEDGKIFNTICDSTHRRQEEVRNLCKQVDVIVVVGGKSSANTKRLGEIAEGMGCKVYMVESESELDAAELSKYDQIGITAGASTPSWMINRVVRVLEAIPGRNEGLTGPLIFKIIRLLMISNLYVSVAGGFLAYASCYLQNIQPRFEYGLIAFCYLFAMHNINRLADQRAKIFNDPISFEFSNKYKNILLTLAVCFLSFSLILTLSRDFLAFILLFVMSIFGILYRIHFIPKFLADKIKVSRLKEIPGSKTLFVALAWALVVVLLPAVIDPAAPGKMTFGVFLFVLFLVFVRNALFDVFEVQGDRIVGKETLPVLIGVKKSMTVLNYIMAGLLLMVTVFPFLGLIGYPIGFWALPGILYIIFFTALYRKGKLNQGVKLEFSLETTFILLFLPVFIGACI